MKPWPMMAIVLLSTARLPASDAVESSKDELHDRAVSELQRTLKAETKFVKVHAAESLLALGYGQDVQGVFQDELKQHGEEPQYRIGVWRVLARSAHDKQQRKFYLQNI